MREDCLLGALRNMVRFPRIDVIDALGAAMRVAMLLGAHNERCEGCRGGEEHDWRLGPHWPLLYLCCASPISAWASLRNRLRVSIRFQATRPLCVSSSQVTSLSC